MRFNSKAFTLVELIAVISVLSFLLILIVPKVKDVYNDSKKDIAYNSAKGLVSTLEEYYVRMKIKNDFPGCIYDFDNNSNNCDDYSFDGEAPDAGSVFLSKDGVVSGYVSFNGYVYEIKNNIVNYYDSSVIPDTIFTFDYTGNSENLRIERDGYYKLEVWGAQGGNGGYSANSIVGRGGYSTGIVYLHANDILYVNVGGQGTGQISNLSGNNINIGGYNGGGNNYNTSGQASSGGGATDIRLFYNSLHARIIVAGGGGGNGYGSDSATGGAGGGLTGTDGSGYSSYTNYGYGASQIAGGEIKATGTNQGYTNTAGSFGQGGIGIGNSHGGGGGGGGWYGGGGGLVAGGGGGSSWIFTEESFITWQNGNPIDAAEYLLDSNYYLSEATTINGNSLMPNHDGTSTMTGNAGNGYVKITYLGLEY